MPKLSKDSPDIGTTDKMKIVGEMWQKQKREKEAGKHTKSKIQSKSKKSAKSEKSSDQESSQEDSN